MVKTHFKFAVMLFALNAGCNSGAFGLDRGRVKVNGLIMSRAQGARTGLNLGQYQTRQTIVYKLPEDFVSAGTNAGTILGMIRKAPEPVRSVVTSLLIPGPGESATESNVTISRDASGVATLSFYAGILLRTGVISYGENVIQLEAKYSEEIPQTLDLTFTVRDFQVAGLAITGFTRPSQNLGQTSDQGDFQGWLSLLTSSHVGEANPNGTPLSFMQSEFFRIINP